MVNVNIPSLNASLFMASKVTTVVTAKHTKYIAKGVVIGFPKITISCAVIIPEES